MIFKRSPIVRMKQNSSFYFKDRYFVFDHIKSVGYFHFSTGLAVIVLLLCGLAPVLYGISVSSPGFVIGGVVVGPVLVLYGFSLKQTHVVITFKRGKQKEKYAYLNFGNGPENTRIKHIFVEHIRAKLVGGDPDIPHELQYSQFKYRRPRDIPASDATGIDVNLPEERVRQYVLQLLQTDFGYTRSDIDIEVPIQMGSSTKRIDIAIYRTGMPHTQDNIDIIVECKRSDRVDKGSAGRQLKSYMSACLNVRYGVVASDKWLVYQKIADSMGMSIERIPALPAFDGNAKRIEYKPDQDVVRAG